MANEINMNEFEKQRYDYIKQSDKYLELNILIGTQKEIYKDRERENACNWIKFK